jgi:anti-sigma factor RsiW
VDYCQGLLDATQRAQIARHLADCPHCASEFSLLAESSAALMVGYGPDMWIPVRPVW